MKNVTEKKWEKSKNYTFLSFVLIKKFLLYRKKAKLFISLVIMLVFVNLGFNILRL